MPKILDKFAEKTVNSKGITKKVLMKMRKILIKLFNDPQIIYKISNNYLYMPLSHGLPFYIKDLDFYDSFLPRFSGFLRKKRKNLVYIDVGANIGDSIISISPTRGDYIIGIEPEPKFNQYINKNVKNKPIEIINKLCSSNISSRRVKIVENAGTASLILDNKENFTLETTTIDQLVLERRLKNVDLIKIDTDGHDFEVMRGARKTVEKYHPSIFFECDIFGNKNYLRDINEQLDIFEKCGYESLLIYDNRGFIFGKYSIKERSGLLNLLFTQLIGGILYFDILIASEDIITAFYETELQFFPSCVKDKTKRYLVKEFYR